MFFILLLQIFHLGHDNAAQVLEAHFNVVVQIGIRRLLSEELMTIQLLTLVYDPKVLEVHLHVVGHVSVKGLLSFMKLKFFKVIRQHEDVLRVLVQRYNDQNKVF